MKPEALRSSAEDDGIVILKQGQKDPFRYVDSQVMIFDEEETSYEEIYFDSKGKIADWSNPSLMDDLEDIIEASIKK